MLIKVERKAWNDRGPQRCVKRCGQLVTEPPCIHWKMRVRGVLHERYAHVECWERIHPAVREAIFALAYLEPRLVSPGVSPRK